MSDDLFAVQVLGGGTPSDPYRVGAAYEIDDDEVEFEDDFSKGQVRFEGVPGTEGSRIVVEERYSWGSEFKVYRPLLGQSFRVGALMLPVYVESEEYKTLLPGAPAIEFDDFYAIRIDGAGSPADPLRIGLAYELEEDGEIEFEDDFLKGSVRFEGVPGSENFRIYVEKFESGGLEVKVYGPVVGQTVSVNGQTLPLFVRLSEFKTAGQGTYRYDDDGYYGDRFGGDICTGSSADDRFDCRGIFGKRAGVYWDQAAGGSGSDDYVIGRSAKSCYYDDSKKKLETFLYVEDFAIGDRVSFAKSSKFSRRFELRAVAGSSYERRLGAAGLIGVEKVLVNKDDRGDILMCLKSADGQSLGSLGINQIFG
jgi:hypothetical protein